MTEGRAASDSGQQELVLVLSLLGGLLGSSCCIIQLSLNILSELGVLHPIGCAGFNKILGPLRIYFRCVTLFYFAYKWLYGTKCCSKRTLFIYSIVCLSLMFLPETLRFGSAYNGRLNAIAPSTGHTEHVVYTVDNMGCEACEAHVKRIVESFDGVVYVESVDYETGIMKLAVNRDWNFNDKRLDAKLEAHGYDLLPEGSVTKKMQWDSDMTSSMFSSQEL